MIAARGLSIPVIVSRDETVLDDVKAYGGAQVVISRGGIAERLKALEDKTVVEVSTSFHDILVAVETLLHAGSRRIGVVMRDNILYDAANDFNFMRVKILVRPCRTYGDIERTVRTLREEGAVDGIAGCRFAVAVAQRLGMTSAYVDSGEKSVAKAVNEAVKIVAAKRKETLHLERLNAVIQNIQEGIVLLGEQREPIFFNNVANRIFRKSTRADFAALFAGYLKNYSGEQLIEIDGTKLLFQMIPLQVSSRVANEVLVFQKVENIEKSEQKVRVSMYQKGLYAKQRFSDILTHAPRMKKTLCMAEKFAKTESNILIYGETGTGKEGLAQSIHNASARSKEPFVSVSCASIPPNLIESELFGYVEGAFTGARRSGKKGLFELAHRGTIFLDEIGELPLDIQSRLLRVLQEHEIMRVGDDKIIPLDIRVISATNKDLARMVHEGRFREDLYYRVNVLRVQLPPLRERPEDILPILKFYFEKYAPNGDWETMFPAALRRRLCAYPWPGNVRELRNVAEVFACYAEEQIDDAYVDALFAKDVRAGTARAKDRIEIPLGMSLKDVEQAIIRRMLEDHSPEVVCAKLGISRVTLWRKVKK